MLDALVAGDGPSRSQAESSCGSIGGWNFSKRAPKDLFLYGALGVLLVARHLWREASSVSFLITPIAEQDFAGHADPERRNRVA